MARVLRVLVVAAIGVPLAVAMPGRAVACSCAALDAKKIVNHADVIVAGHVVSQAEVDPVDTRSELAVDGVYKGDVGATLSLSAAIGPGGGSSCAVLYPVGSRVDPLVLLRGADGTYEIDTCSMVVAPEIAKLLGDPRPAPSAGPTGAAVPPPVASAPARTGGVSWPAVGGGLVLAVALIAFGLWRSGRRYAEELVSDAGGSAGAAEVPPPTAGDPSD